VRTSRTPALRSVRTTAAFLLAAAIFFPGGAAGATKNEVRDAAVRAADRLPTVQVLSRSWEDAPYLVGLLLLARELDRQAPGSGQPLIDRAAAVVGAGTAPVANGDYAGYAQAAMDLYRISSPAGTPRRAALLDATNAPFAFALQALRVTPSSGPPAVPWWLDGGYGTRFWVDDLFTLPPWLAMRGSSLDGLPADPLARDLAYEWIESYVYDHRPPATGATSPDVPSQRERAGPLLWDPILSLFRHDAGPGWESYWGRGNGWAAWGLARSARYLDAPYQGGRYDMVVDRAGIRELLSRFASSLAVRRSDDGGWPTDLLLLGACGGSETSATGFITYMLAKGVNEGWLDRAAYVPIVLKSLSVLLGRLDVPGDLAAIQPPGTGPDCSVTASNDPSVDVSYGVGAFLLAASEALRLPDADLATMEAEAALPVDRTPVGRTWIVALPGGCERPEVRLTNAGTATVKAHLETGLDASVTRAAVSVPPGGTVVVEVPGALASDTPPVYTLRADGDLGVQPRAVCDWLADARDPAPVLFRFQPRRAGAAVPLWASLAGGERTSYVQPRDGLLTVGGRNVSPASSTMVVTAASPDGTQTETLRVELPPGGAAFSTLFVTGGSLVTLSNTSQGASFVPLTFVRR
jgi:hypothetical protein